MNNKFDMITAWLSKDDKAIALDKALFEQWKQGEKTTSECKSGLISNNSFPTTLETMISDELMVEWLHSIGWYRKGERK